MQCHCPRLRMYPCMRPQRFSCQPTSHISFGISFKLCKWPAMAEIWPPYCFGSPVVKIKLCGVKSVKNFAIACVQAVGQIYFILVHELVGITSCHPIFFVGLGPVSRSLLKIKVTLNSRIPLIFSLL